MEYIKLIRPKHYIKNFLIFLPLIFSGMLLQENNLFKTFIGFICFSFIASCVYIVNDIKDKEKDRKHKTKCNRPIASGKVSVRNAIIFMIMLLAITVCLVVCFRIPLNFVLLIGLYFIINLGYSFGLKNIPLLDVFIIVVGFLIRVMCGAVILDIEVSNWLYLTILAGSFYLALGKRRNEIDKNGKDARKVLKFYNKEFLDKNMYMCLSMAIIFYSLWATDSTLVEKTNNLLIWTIPLVIVICMKYSMDIEGNSDGDPVEVIVKDKFIIFLVLLLGISIILLLYI